MRILVTGGTGFIGKHLVKRLTGQEHELRLLSRNPERYGGLESKSTKFISGNLSDVTEWKDEVKEFNPRAAIHLAWEGIPDYSSVTSIKNLMQGINLYSLLAETDCKQIISTGSGWEYGLQRGSLAETTAINPHNAFAAAKNSLHWVGRHLAEENGMQFDWLRIFYVYGPGQREGAIIPYIIRCIKDGRIPEIKTPSASNDFVYIEDVVEAITKLSVGSTADDWEPGQTGSLVSDYPRSLPRSQHGSVYNIGSGTLTRVGEIISLIYTKLGKEPDIACEGNKISPHYDGSFADLTHIKERIGWEPRVNLSEGISRMIAAGELGG